MKPTAGLTWGTMLRVQMSNQGSCPFDPFGVVAWHPEVWWWPISNHRVLCWSWSGGGSWPEMRLQICSCWHWLWERSWGSFGESSPHGPQQQRRLGVLGLHASSVLTHALILNYMPYMHYLTWHTLQTSYSTCVFGKPFSENTNMVSRTCSLGLHGASEASHPLAAMFRMAGCCCFFGDSLLQLGAGKQGQYTSFNPDASGRWEFRLSAKGEQACFQAWEVKSKLSPSCPQSQISSHGVPWSYDNYMQFTIQLTHVKIQGSSLNCLASKVYFSSGIFGRDPEEASSSCWLAILPVVYLWLRIPTIHSSRSTHDGSGCWSSCANMVS